MTGAAGFVGHHVLKHLLDNTDFEIVCLIRLNCSGNLKNLLPFDDNPRVKFTYHDLKFSINEALREDIGCIDYILHIGANSHVDRSITHPKEFFEDNLMGTINLLEYMRLYMPKARMINFSTDEVYGPAPEKYKFKEEDRFRPSNPYSASKAAQIEAGHSYFRTYGLDIISTFTMNIFGPDQNSEKLIPKAIRYAKERKPMPIFAELSNGELISVGSRYWLYVSNVGASLLFILKNGIKGEYYNIVGTEELTNEDVVKRVNQLLGIQKPLTEYTDFHKCRPGHDRRYALDGTKLQKLGWVPSISFDEGIKLVIKKV